MGKGWLGKRNIKGSLGINPASRKSVPPDGLFYSFMTFVLMREPQQGSRFFVAVPCSFLWRCVEQHVPDAQKNIPCGRIATRRELSKNDVDGILVYYNLFAFGVVSGGNPDVNSRNGGLLFQFHSVCRVPAFFGSQEPFALSTSALAPLLPFSSVQFPGSVSATRSFPSRVTTGAELSK